MRKQSSTSVWWIWFQSGAFLLVGIEATQHSGVRSYLEYLGFPLAVASVVVGIRLAKGMKEGRESKHG